MSTIITNNNTSNKMRVKLDEDRFEEVQISYIKSEGRQEEGIQTEAIGEASHAEGYKAKAEGSYSHAEGNETWAFNSNSHAEGYRTQATGGDSHAEGDRTAASGDASHAEGSETEASGNYSHAEGSETKASNYYSHAEGIQTQASGIASHVEGYSSYAKGDYSHAEGYGTIASGDRQHVQGKYNIEDTENEYAFIIGNGNSGKDRSNAHTLDWYGNAWFAGNVTVGANNKLATEEYVSSAIEAIEPYQLPQATSKVLGGVKTGYGGDGKNYAVNLNDNGQMYVTVPWTDTNDNTTYTLSQGTNNGEIKLTSSSGSENNIKVPGLGSAAYTDSKQYVKNSDNHNFQIDWDGGEPILNIDWNVNQWNANRGLLTKSKASVVRSANNPNANTFNIQIGDDGVAEGELPVDRLENIFTGIQFSGGKDYTAQLLVATPNIELEGSGCRQGGVYVRATSRANKSAWSNWLELSTRIYARDGSVDDYAELKAHKENGKITSIAFQPAKSPTSTDAVFNIGNPKSDSVRQWATVYATNGVASTSDIRKKQNLSKIQEDSRYLQLFDVIEPYKYQMKNTNNLHYHTGFIAQYVEDALLQVGLTESDCAFLEKIKTDDDDYNYYLNYNEYIAIMAAKIKSLEKRIEELENK